jgi:uncharacterized membrane protein
MKIALISLLYIIGPVIIILIYNRYKTARKIGTILMSYCLGIIMALSGLVKPDFLGDVDIKPIQEWIMNLAVPLAIPLMLLSSDFRLWRKSMKKTFATLIGGIIAVTIACFSAYMIFNGKGINDLWKVSGMMIGMYTGGTMNFAAIGNILEIDPTVFTLVSAFEMVLSFFFLMFMIGGGYKIIRKILPFHDKSITKDPEEDINYSFEKYKGMLKPRIFRKTLLGFLLSLVFLIIGAGLSMVITGKLNELVIIFTITTLAICTSFINKIRRLPKTFELGMYFINMFSVVIASQFDITSLNSQNLLLIVYIAFIIITATLLHLLIARIAKVDGDLFTVSHVGLLYSPPFVPPVVGAMGNKKVLISGILIGLVGYAIDTYLGVAVSEVLKFIG